MGPVPSLNTSPKMSLHFLWCISFIANETLEDSCMNRFNVSFFCHIFCMVLIAIAAIHNSIPCFLKIILKLREYFVISTFYGQYWAVSYLFGCVPKWKWFCWIIKMWISFKYAGFFFQRNGACFLKKYLGKT